MSPSPCRAGDAPILVLDEALSAVDAENEAVIGEALDRLMQGRTTLVIAHRLSSVIDCDEILVLDGERVAQSGTHAELMAAGGSYATLMADQARESGYRLLTIRPEPADGADGAGFRRHRDRHAGRQAETEGVIRAPGNAAFRKLDALAPAYLVRRRTGDLMALATHDIELVEYFFAHTIAPAFVAVLVPAVVLIVLGTQSLWLMLVLLPFLVAVASARC